MKYIILFIALWLSFCRKISCSSEKIDVSLRIAKVFGALFVDTTKILIFRDLRKPLAIFMHLYVSDYSLAKVE